VTTTESIGPVFKNVAMSAEAKLVDTVPMATEDYPDREFLPERILVHYHPSPAGWQLSSVYITGHAVLKSGELGKSRRSAYFRVALGGRVDNLGDCPVWAREFANLHCPTGE